MSLLPALLIALPLSAADLPGWTPLTFKKVERPTEYRLVKEAGREFICAHSSASASALVKTMSVKLSREPVLRWRWKVDRALETADAYARSGDDYAARVYVAFLYDPERADAWMRAKYGLAKTLYKEYPPHAAINYVWDNRLPTGTMLDNAYSSRVKMIVLRSGDREAGQWVEERRNVVEDYRQAFGEEPPPLQFVAIMSDTDQTGESVTACFDALAFQAP